MGHQWLCAGPQKRKLFNSPEVAPQIKICLGKTISFELVSAYNSTHVVAKSTFFFIMLLLTKQFVAYYNDNLQLI